MPENSPEHTLNNPEPDPALRPRASRRVRRNRIIAVIIVAAVVVLGGGIAAAVAISSNGSTQAADSNLPSPDVATPSISPTPTPTSPALSIDDPNSLWVVVNKLRPLNPPNYEPSLVPVPVAHTWSPQLRPEASDAVVQMFQAAAQEAGLSLASNSAYRSYASQTEVYNSEINSGGRAYADSTTARPGYSEHQTGLAIDIGMQSGRCSLDVCFADTPAGMWLRDNAWRFGFLLRYPADKVQVTGYSFEPWHFRYIGTELAAKLHATGVATLEEYFSLPPADHYG